MRTPMQTAEHMLKQYGTSEAFDNAFDHKLNHFDEKGKEFRFWDDVIDCIYHLPLEPSPNPYK